MAIVAIPQEPGESIRRDILPFVVAMRERFKIDVTDGYSRDPVHSATGDHPKALGLDVIPDFKRGGTWDDVDAAVAWGKTQLGAGKLFRWIGYNGVPGHGRGHHAHFGFNDDAAKVFEHSADVGTKDGDGGGIGVDDVLKGIGLVGVSTTLGPIGPAVAGIGVASGQAGDAVDAVAGAAGSLALELLEGLVDIFGADGARILLYVSLVLGGMTLAGLGIARASGVRAGDVGQLATMAVTRGAAGRGAGAAKAAA